MRTLAGLGLRVGEAISLDVSDQSHNRGHRTIRYIGKGGIHRERVLPAHALDAVDEYLATRAALTGVGVDALTGPLFATTSTTGDPGRLDEPAIFRHIRRMARHAGLPAADRLSPHSLRHAFATTAREEGVPLEDAQDSMDHADPRTTRAATFAPPAATTATGTTSTATPQSPSAPATPNSNTAVISTTARPCHQPRPRLKKPYDHYETAWASGAGAGRGHEVPGRRA
jgi:integrase